MIRRWRIGRWEVRIDGVLHYIQNTGTSPAVYFAGAVVVGGDWVQELRGFPTWLEARRYLKVNKPLKPIGSDV